MNDKRQGPTDISRRDVRVEGDVRNISPPKEGDFIPADKKPKNGGWHWPTYWQVKAAEAKEIPR